VYFAQNDNNAGEMLYKIFCTITHITEMQHCLTKC